MSEDDIRKIASLLCSALLSTVVVTNVCLQFASAQDSVFPLGGQRGTQFDVVIPGIGGSEAVWFDSDGLTATVRVESDGSGSQNTRMHVHAAPDATLGYHSFRLIQPSGILGPLPLLIHDEPKVLEKDTPHATPQAAQTITWPSAVHGRIREKGEIDYYALEVAAGDHLLIELNTSSGLLPGNIGARLMNEPELTLLAPTGSWFDPLRPVRLWPEDHSTFFYWPRQPPAERAINHLPRFSHRFEEAGWYLIEVTEREGLGSIDHGYQLRIADATDGSDGETTWTARELLRARPLEWQERDFVRPVDANWLREIFQRSGGPVEPSDGAAPQTGAAREPSAELHVFQRDLPIFSEAEPNDAAGEAEAVSVPTLVTGRIGSVGDDDYFRLEVEAGDQLCFELRTPDLPPPHFSPRLDVLDAAGTLIFSNIYTKVGGDGDDWIKTLEPKSMHTFSRGGEVLLRIRDLTNRRGGPRCAYQLVVRPQLPHVGEFVLTTFTPRGVRYLEDAVNIKPGQSKKFVAVIEKEEGYEESYALSIEDLPAGVDLLPLSDEAPDVSFTDQYESRGVQDKFRHRPPREAVLLLLRAAPDAPLSPLSAHFVTLTCWPRQDGKVMAPIEGHRVPLMVVP